MALFHVGEKLLELIIPTYEKTFGMRVVGKERNKFIIYPNYLLFLRRLRNHCLDELRRELQ
jgi:hypothetical protein